MVRLAAVLLSVSTHFPENWATSVGSSARNSGILVDFNSFESSLESVAGVSGTRQQPASVDLLKSSFESVSLARPWPAGSCLRVALAMIDFASLAKITDPALRPFRDFIFAQAAELSSDPETVRKFLSQLVSFKFQWPLNFSFSSLAPLLAEGSNTSAVVAQLRTLTASQPGRVERVVNWISDSARFAWNTVKGFFWKQPLSAMPVGKSAAEAEAEAATAKSQTPILKAEAAALERMLCGELLEFAASLLEGPSAGLKQAKNFYCGPEADLSVPVRAKPEFELAQAEESHGKRLLRELELVREIHGIQWTGTKDIGILDEFVCPEPYGELGAKLQEAVGRVPAKAVPGARVGTVTQQWVDKLHGLIKQPDIPAHVRAVYEARQACLAIVALGTGHGNRIPHVDAENRRAVEKALAAVDNPVKELAQSRLNHPFGPGLREIEVPLDEKTKWEHAGGIDGGVYMKTQVGGKDLEISLKTTQADFVKKAGLGVRSVFWTDQVQSAGFSFVDHWLGTGVMHLNLHGFESRCQEGGPGDVVKFKLHPGHPDIWITRAAVQVNENTKIHDVVAIWDTGEPTLSVKKHIWDQISEARKRLTESDVIPGDLTEGLKSRSASTQGHLKLSLYGEDGGKVQFQLLAQTHLCDTCIKLLKDYEPYDIVVGTMLLARMYTLFYKGHSPHILACAGVGKAAVSSAGKSSSVLVARTLARPCTVELTSDGMKINLNGRETLVYPSLRERGLNLEKITAPEGLAILSLSCREGGRLNWRQTAHTGISFALGLSISADFFLAAGVESVGFERTVNGLDLIRFNSVVSCDPTTRSYFEVIRTESDWQIDKWIVSTTINSVPIQLEFSGDLNLVFLRELTINPTFESDFKLGEAKAQLKDLGLAVKTPSDKAKALYRSLRNFNLYFNYELHRPLDGSREAYVMVCNPPPIQ